MSEIWRRLRDSNVALGIGGGEERFFALLTFERRSVSDFLVEVIFSPEVVSIDGAGTDIIVTWGSVSDIRDWVDRFAGDVSLELAPPSREQELVRHYFTDPGERIAVPNAWNPWSMD